MNRDTSRPDKLARQMFFVGLLGLPWLWIVNILYFFDRVYGRLPCFGQQHTGTPSSSNDSAEQNTAILGLFATAGTESHENSDNGDEQEGPSNEEIQQQLSKWVKRSTIGSFIYISIMVSWIVIFQLNKEYFGPGWLVYSSSSDVISGW